MRPLPLVITVVLVSGCTAGQATAPASTGQVSSGVPHTTSSQHPQAACSGPPSGLPATIRAIPLTVQSGPGIVQPGTPVPAAHIGGRAAATSRLIFGLGGTGSGSVLGTYPAISTDGGRHWRIDGPRFYYPAAQGAGVANRIGARAPEFAYVWGDGGNAVRVTTDAGRHWQVAWFPGGVHSVYWSHGQLNAQALGSQLPDCRFPTYLYVSPDHGRTWTMRQQLGTVQH